MHHQSVGSRRPRGWVSLARRLAIVFAVCWLGVVLGPTGLASGLASQPTTLSLSLSLPSQLPAGVPWHQRIVATGQGIFGCYRWQATGLPLGLRLADTVTCVPKGRTVTTLINDIRGTPQTEGPAVATTVTITLDAIGPSMRARTAPRPAGTASAMLIILPPAWAASGSPLQYEGSALSAVACTLGPSCWVVGTSRNPLPPGTGTQAMPATGESPISPSSSSSSHPPLIEGGTFVAALQSINPLRMDVVREAIPLSVTGIACPTVTACVLVGSESLGHQGSVPAVLYMTGSGAVWRVSVISPAVTGSFSALSCLTPANCLAVGSLTSGSGFIDRITLSGPQARLAPLRKLGAGLSSISCANAASCLVVGRSRSVLATKGEIQVGTDALIEATGDGGDRWHLAQVAGPDGFGRKEPGHEQPWLSTVDGPLLFGGLVGVGCAPSATTNSCDVTWPYWPAAASTSDGLHWYPNVLTVGAVGGPGDSVSCPTLGRCFSVTTKQFVANNDAVQTVTQILETIPASPGWQWGIAGQGPDSAYSPSLVSISCPTLSTCVAVGSWYPAQGSAGGSPVYPLVMAPQLAMHPFFKPHPPPWSPILSWQTLGLILGALSLVSGVGGLADLMDFEVVTENLPTYVLDVFSYVRLPYNFVVDKVGIGMMDVLSFLSGALSTGIGAASISSHDPIGWLAVGLGVVGLASWSVGLASLTAGGADPTDGTSATRASTLPPQLDAGPTPSITGEG